MAILLRAIRLFVPLSTTEYNGNGQDQYSCSCQDTMKFESYTGYIRLISKTNCPVKLHVSLTTKGTYRGTLRGPRLHCLRECLNLSGTGGYSAPEAMDSNLKNLALLAPLLQFSLSLGYRVALQMYQLGLGTIQSLLCILTSCRFL